jgi:hypothetical protein
MATDTTKRAMLARPRVAGESAPPRPVRVVAPPPRAIDLPPDDGTRMDRLEAHLFSVEAREHADADWLSGLQARIDALEARPTAGTTWADLIERWTSRKWLIAFIPGVIAFITTIGAMLGDVDPRIPAGAAVVTTILGSIFTIMEGQTDRAVRVAEVETAAARNS